MQTQDAENRDGEGTHNRSNSTVETNSTVGIKHDVDRARDMGMTYIDICAGCGSMSMAAEELGFRPLAQIEQNKNCVKTLLRNNFSKVIHADARVVDYTPFKRITLFLAGIPCQPFSIGGQGDGEADERSLWTTTLRAIDEAQPSFFIIENAWGFLRARFNDTRAQVTQHLRGSNYTVIEREVSAIDYGLPQERRRYLLIGHLHQGLLAAPMIEPYCDTVRDVLQDLGAPNGQNRHDIKGYARAYPGHEPSILDKPAKTVRAGCHGPGGGSNTVRLDDGTIWSGFPLRGVTRPPRLSRELRSWRAP